MSGRTQKTKRCGIVSDSVDRPLCPSVESAARNQDRCGVFSPSAHVTGRTTTSRHERRTTVDNTDVTLHTLPRLSKAGAVDSLAPKQDWLHKTRRAAAPTASRSPSTPPLRPRCVWRGGRGACLSLLATFYALTCPLLPSLFPRRMCVARFSTDTREPLDSDSRGRDIIVWSHFLSLSFFIRDTIGTALYQQLWWYQVTANDGSLDAFGVRWDVILMFVARWKLKTSSDNWFLWIERDYKFSRIARYVCRN